MGRTDRLHGKIPRPRLEVGLPAIAFTEHVDHTVTTVATDRIEPGHPLLALTDADGRLAPPPLDLEGYLASVERCRDLFPDLRIVAGLLSASRTGTPTRRGGCSPPATSTWVLGSLHALPIGDVYLEPPGLFGHWDPDEVVRRYLAEIIRLVADSDAFAVLAHIDYRLRYWDPAEHGSYDVGRYEDDLRDALRALADSGRALEINTVLPLDASILRWWHDEGGEAVTFGSDAHEPDEVAAGFHDAAAMADEALGSARAATPSASGRGPERGRLGAAGVGRSELRPQGAPYSVSRSRNGTASNAWTEHAGAGPGAARDQLERDDRVDRGLPDHALVAVLLHRPLVVDHVVEVR